MRKAIIFLSLISFIGATALPIFAAPATKKPAQGLLFFKKPKPTPKPLPQALRARIRQVRIMPCTSSSCSGAGWLTTLRVNGTNFTPHARVAVVNGQYVYSEDTSFNNNPDAQYVGGDGKRTILTDFYNLPTCKIYDVRVYFPDTSYTTKKKAFSLPCG